MRKIAALLLTVAAVATANEVTYTVDPAGTVTRFLIEEELFGSPKTVVGVTSAVEGSIVVSSQDELWLSFRPFQVDARSFVTDDGRRNGAIQRFILQSVRDQYRYITFTPSAVRGLPSAPPSGSVTISITGEMTIREVTRAVVFEATVDMSDQARISGSANATVNRSDFELRIPRVPFVANVAEVVVLEIEFVATRARS